MYWVILLYSGPSSCFMPYMPMICRRKLEHDQPFAQTFPETVDEKTATFRTHRNHGWTLKTVSGHSSVYLLCDHINLIKGQCNNLNTVKAAIASTLFRQETSCEHQAALTGRDLTFASTANWCLFGNNLHTQTSTFLKPDARRHIQIWFQPIKAR